MTFVYFVLDSYPSQLYCTVFYVHKSFSTHHLLSAICNIIIATTPHHIGPTLIYVIIFTGNGDEDKKRENDYTVCFSKFRSLSQPVRMGRRLLPRSKPHLSWKISKIWGINMFFSRPGVPEVWSTGPVLCISADVTLTDDDTNSILTHDVNWAILTKLVVI